MKGQQFGFWQIMDDEGLHTESYGIIDYDKMLFFETNENGELAGNTINLQRMTEWIIIQQEQEKELGWI